jgi:hypothetical protein
MTMFHFTTQTPPAIGKRWRDAIPQLELLFSQFYERLVTSGAPEFNCGVSIISNPYYMLSAIASMSRADNPDVELVIDGGYHRRELTDNDVSFTAEVCREQGPPLAALPGRMIPLSENDCVSQADLVETLNELQSFLASQQQLVTQQLEEMFRPAMTISCW